MQPRVRVSSFLFFFAFSWRGVIVVCFLYAPLSPHLLPRVPRSCSLRCRTRSSFLQFSCSPPPRFVVFGVRRRRKMKLAEWKVKERRKGGGERAVEIQADDRLSPRRAFKCRRRRLLLLLLSPRSTWRMCVLWCVVSSPLLPLAFLAPPVPRLLLSRRSLLSGPFSGAAPFVNPCACDGRLPFGSFCRLLENGAVCFFCFYLKRKRRTDCYGVARYPPPVLPPTPPLSSCFLRPITCWRVGCSDSELRPAGFSREPYFRSALLSSFKDSVCTIG